MNDNLSKENMVLSFRDGMYFVWWMSSKNKVELEGKDGVFVLYCSYGGKIF